MLLPFAFALQRQKNTSSAVVVEGLHPLSSQQRHCLIGSNIMKLSSVVVLVGAAIAVFCPGASAATAVSFFSSAYRSCLVPNPSALAWAASDLAPSLMMHVCCRILTQIVNISHSPMILLVHLSLIHHI